VAHREDRGVADRGDVAGADAPERVDPASGLRLGRQERRAQRAGPLGRDEAEVDQVIPWSGLARIPAVGPRLDVDVDRLEPMARRRRDGDRGDDAPDRPDRAPGPGRIDDPRRPRAGRDHDGSGRLEGAVRHRHTDNPPILPGECDRLPEDDLDPAPGGQLREPRRGRRGTHRVSDREPARDEVGREGRLELTERGSFDDLRAGVGPGRGPFGCDPVRERPIAADVQQPGRLVRHRKRRRGGGKRAVLREGRPVELREERI
jgi:hypothetical protein